MGFIKGALIVSIIVVLVALSPRILKPKVSSAIHGSCTKEFASVEQAYRKLFEDGTERGGALSVYYEGQPVCDLWGGFADETIGRPWQKDSMGLWFSATKGVCAISLMRLFDKGLFNYKEPVKKYWPEFAQNGKDDMTIETLISHSGGLAAIDEDMTMIMVKDDPDAIGRALAAQKPNWEPGTQHGYHALTQGLIIDQLVRHIDPKHRSLQQFFQDEIARPFGIDFFIGAPKSEHYRIARFHRMNTLDLLLNLMGDINAAWLMIPMMMGTGNPIFKKAFNNPRPGSPESAAAALDFYNWPEGRETPLGSVSGFGTARAIARLYGIVANGGSDKERVLLSKNTIKMLYTPLRNGVDAVIGANITYGYGVMHNYDNIEGRHRVGHPGYGGQMGFADIDHNYAYGYVTNHPSLKLGENDIRSVRVRAAIYEAIKNKTTE